MIECLNAYKGSGVGCQAPEDRKQNADDRIQETAFWLVNLSSVFSSLSSVLFPLDTDT